MSTDRNLFESFLDAVQKPESAGISTVADIIGIKNVPTYKQILAGEKYDPNRFYSDIEQQLGIDLTSGDPENQTWLDTVINTARNIGTGIVLDPTTYISPIGKASKVLGDIVATKPVVQAISKFGVGEKTAKKIVERTMLGTTLGALSYDKNEDDVVGNMVKMGLGMGLGLTGAGAVSRFAGKEILEKGGDLIARGSAPNAFRDVEQMLENTSEITRKTGVDVAKEFGPVKLSRAVEILRGAKGKLNTASRLYQEEMGKVYDILGDNKEALDAYEVVSSELANASFKKRADLLSGKKIGPLTYKEFSEELFNATKSANAFATGVREKLIQEIQNPSVRELVNNAVSTQVNANKKFISYYNQVNHADDIRSLAGFDYHKYNFFEPKEFEDTIDAFATSFSAGFKMRKGIEAKYITEETFKKLEKLGGTRKDALAIAGDRLASVFLDEHEKAARMLVARYSQEVQSTNPKFTSFLELFDSTTKLLKSAQLGLGTNFFFNQIPENITRASIATSTDNIAARIKALVADGKIDTDTAELYFKNMASNPANLITTALSTIASKRTYKDIYDDFISKGKTGGVFVAPNANDNKLLNLLSDIGVLNTNKIADYKALASELPELFNTQYGKELRQLAKQDRVGAVSKIADFFDNTANKIFEKSYTTRFGAMYEDMMKVSTYKAVVKSILGEKNYQQFIKHADSMGRAMNVKGFDETIARSAEELAQIKYYKSVYDKFGGAVEVARDVVEKAFVDYTAIKPWERQIASRLIPYWSYMSRSIPMFLRAISNPDTIDKTLIAEKFLRGPGSSPTSDDRRYMNEYLRQTGSSKIPNTEKYYTQSANPLVESVGFASDPMSIFPKGLFSMNPILKSAIELASDTDLFALASGKSNTSLIPTEDRPKKVLGNEAGLLSQLPILKDLIYKDDKTNQDYTTSVGLARLASVKRNLLPAPIIDQYYKMKKEEVTPSLLGSLREYTGDIDKIEKQEQRREENRYIIENGLPVTKKIRKKRRKKRRSE